MVRNLIELNCLNLIIVKATISGANHARARPSLSNYDCNVLCFSCFFSSFISIDCLKTSLLTSLPLLLDQSHLTDVTLSAEGRTVRAHRVVLSACSSFFSELFRTLDSPFHPVIVIPGATFGSIVALLTFMYSGEVNVFEEQISTLLSLAETLGIKGLADINGVSFKTKFLLFI